MAVHGWWLGNPLVYKPGTPDLVAVARELAVAGAASGTIVVSDAPAAPTTNDPAPGVLVPLMPSPDHVEAVLILRPPLALASAALAQAALHAVAETAQVVLDPNSSRPGGGGANVVRRPSQVVLLGLSDTSDTAGDEHGVQLCSVEVEEHADVAYVRLRLALDHLRMMGEAGRRDTGAQQAIGMGTRFFARPDWREVFLARMLHALEGHLKEQSSNG